MAPGALLMQPLSAPSELLHPHMLRVRTGTDLLTSVCWAGVIGPHGNRSCASGATCMLLMMKGPLSVSGLPCTLCGILTLPC